MSLFLSEMSLLVLPQEKKKKRERSGCWWLTPVILDTWEAEIRSVLVGGQPKQIVHESLFPK
jgi:hypothetical protein